MNRFDRYTLFFLALFGAAIISSGFHMHNALAQNTNLEAPVWSTDTPEVFSQIGDDLYHPVPLKNGSLFQTHGLFHTLLETHDAEPNPKEYPFWQEADRQADRGSDLWYELATHHSPFDCLDDCEIDSSQLPTTKL